MLGCKCCYKCVKRTMTCHSTCGEYKGFRAAKDEENAKIHAAKKAERNINGYIIESIEKNRRRRGDR